MRNLANRGASSLIVQAYAQPFVLDAFLAGLDEWVRSHFVYRGENQEVIRTPEFMLTQLERDGFFDGDCDDVSTLYASLLKALHYSCRFVAIRPDDSPDFKHVYIEVWMGKDLGYGWAALDPTVERGTVYHEVERMVMDV